MEKLIREIEQKDIAKLRELMKLVFDDGEWEDIQRLGGMTNRSYNITRKDGQGYLVRIPGEGTEKMINRVDERKSTELACRLNIDSPLLYFDDDGCKIMKYIFNPQPMNEKVMQKKENLFQAARIFHKLHTCGADTGVHFEVFKMADLYENIIHEENVSFYEDYDAVKNTVINIKTETDKNRKIRKVPCHNDSLVDNWVLDGRGRLYLVDWEYSGMNEAMWDLSCLSIEASYTAENDEELLHAYYGRKATADEKRRLIASKLYVDYLWTLWGLTRIPFDGEFMQKYADLRYARLKYNIESYKNS